MPATDRRTARSTKVALLVAFLLPVFAIPAGIGAVTLGGSEAAVVGQLVAQHGDDVGRGRSEVSYVVKSESGVERVQVSASQAERLVGRQVRVAVAADGSNTVRAALTPASYSAGGTAGTGQHRVAVVLLNFSNNPTQPFTPAFAAGVAFNNANSVAAFYNSSSAGKLTLTGDVLGWYTIPDANSTCSPTTWASSAGRAAAAAGVNLSGYDHVVYAFPEVAACTWGGWAEIPGRNSWLNGAGAMSLRLMAHELGHNFGTHHAASLTCTESGARVSLSKTASNCALGEYGDPFSVMGGSSYEHTGFARGNYGWLSAGNTRTVTTAGDYSLIPLEANNEAAVKSIVVARTTSTFFSLEFRQPGLSPFDSFSAASPVANGVSIRITPSYSTLTQSQLIDTTPATTSFSDAPLAVGKTLVDPLSGISFTTLAVSAAGATVRIGYSGSTPAPDTQAPSAPATLLATGLDQSRIALSWGASTDNVGVTGYRISRNGTVVATVAGTSWTDSGLAPATSYTYAVVALDAVGNASLPASAAATTATSDTQAPSAPTGLVGSLAKGKKVSLSWQASADNQAVAGYRILRDGTVIGTTAVTGYSDTLAGKRPSASYTVVAFDAAGNVSAASNRVSLGG